MGNLEQTVAGSSQGTWHYDLESGGMNIQPVEAKLFSKDQLKHLVHEGFQNALDAVIRADGARNPVLVRIDNRRILRSELGDVAFSEIVERADASGYDVSDIGDEITVLEFYDNGTGLDRKSYDRFTRTIGESGKGGNSGGRHGCGRTVLLHSSAAHVMYVHSVFHENGLSLFGGVSSHRRHSYEGKKYQAYGVFGVPARNADGEEVQGPIEGNDAFRLAANLGSTRQPGEHGVSVFVPALNANWTAAVIAREVIKEQFFPIIAGQLSVVISDGQTEIPLNSETFVEQASKLAEDGRVARGANGDMHKLARAVKAIIADEPVQLPNENFRSAPEELMAPLRAAYSAGNPVVVSVPLGAEHQVNGIVAGRLRICALRDDTLQKMHDVLVRDAISHHKPASGDKRIVITLSCDDPISSLLGDAETASHDQWHEKSAQEKGWHSPKPLIDAFKFGGSRLAIELAKGGVDEEDFSLLGDLFPMLSEEALKPEAEGKVAAAEDPEIPGQTTDAVQQVVETTETDETEEPEEGGDQKRTGPVEMKDMREGLFEYSTRPEPNGTHSLVVSLSSRGRRYVKTKGVIGRAEFATGYAYLAADGVKNYAANDYDLSKFVFECEGAAEATGENNEFTITDINEDLLVAIKGPFDHKRDLEIKLVSKE